jgi:hypothetical protein
MPQFQRYIGIDYSGAVTPDSSCKGLRVYVAEGSGEPIQVQPRPSPRLYWTRRGLAEWLCEELDRDIPTLVGIDHAFSFPMAYSQTGFAGRPRATKPRLSFEQSPRLRSSRTWRTIPFIAHFKAVGPCDGQGRIGDCFLP